MALQGNLRDFSATEILQLVGSQKKSGCLTLEWNTERSVVWVTDGRLVSTRQLGAAKDDSLLAFLRVTHRLSEEQERGLLTIQKESGRDIEDLLVNGRYLDAQELAGYVERQILTDLQRIVRWDNGTYRFDPNARWEQPPLVMLSMEGVMIEAARRMDEEKRFVTVFRDPYALLGVRDLPDPDEPLSDEERELFGIIDGNHTVAEVVAEAPLSEYEAYEALHRLLESNWIEFVGRQAPDQKKAEEPATPAPHASSRGRNGVLQELALAGAFVGLVVGLHFAGDRFAATQRPAPKTDVFVVAQVRDLKFALDLYERENGRYPARLDDLVEDHWIAARHVRLPGFVVSYRADDGGHAYKLAVTPDRDARH
jgi:hypothetical protein